MGKQLVNFITCGCESSAPFCNLQSRARTNINNDNNNIHVYIMYDFNIYRGPGWLNGLGSWLP